MHASMFFFFQLIYLLVACMHLDVYYFFPNNPRQAAVHPYFPFFQFIYLLLLFSCKACCSANELDLKLKKLYMHVGWG